MSLHKKEDQKVTHTSLNRIRRRRKRTLRVCLHQKEVARGGELHPEVGGDDVGIRHESEHVTKTEEYASDRTK